MKLLLDRHRVRGEAQEVEARAVTVMVRGRPRFEIIDNEDGAIKVRALEGPTGNWMFISVEPEAANTVVIRGRKG